MYRSLLPTQQIWPNHWESLSMSLSGTKKSRSKHQYSSSLTPKGRPYSSAMPLWEALSMLALRWAPCGICFQGSDTYGDKLCSDRKGTNSNYCLWNWAIWGLCIWQKDLYWHWSQTSVVYYEEKSIESTEAIAENAVASTKIWLRRFLKRCTWLIHLAELTLPFLDET